MTYVVYTRNKMFGADDLSQEGRFDLKTLDSVSVTTG